MALMVESIPGLGGGEQEGEELRWEGRGGGEEEEAEAGGEGEEGAGGRAEG